MPGYRKPKRYFEIESHGMTVERYETHIIQRCSRKTVGKPMARLEG